MAPERWALPREIEPSGEVISLGLDYVRSRYRSSAVGYMPRRAVGVAIQMQAESECDDSACRRAVRLKTRTTTSDYSSAS